MQQSPRPLYDLCLEVLSDQMHQWSGAHVVTISTYLEAFHRSARAQLEDNPEKSSSSEKRPRSFQNILSAFFKRRTEPDDDDSDDDSDESEAENEKNEERSRRRKPTTRSASTNLFFRLSQQTCQDLLRHYQRRHKFTDRILLLPYFDANTNTYTSFRVENASNITPSGLRALRQHSLVHVKMARMVHCTISDLIGNLSPWSLSHLESLEVPHTTFARYNTISIVLSLTKLCNLVHLDISHTPFNNHCLEIISDHLSHLQSLNISATRVTCLAPLLKFQSTLTKLGLYNVAQTCRDEGDTLSQLTSLHTLDISDDRFQSETTSFEIDDRLSQYLGKLHHFPQLTSLDISGRQCEIEDVIALVRHRVNQHRKDSKFTALKFIGLGHTRFGMNEMIDLDFRTNGQMLMSGNGNLSHIIQSLKRYRDRPFFVQKSLVQLFNYTVVDMMGGHIEHHHHPPHHQQQAIIYEEPLDDQSWDSIDMWVNEMNANVSNEEVGEFRDDQHVDVMESFTSQMDDLKRCRVRLIIMVVETMETYLKSLTIVLVATGCLHNLTKGFSRLHPHVLQRVCRVAIDAMTQYPTNYQVMKNVLMILQSDQILQNVTFDHLTCLSLVLDSLLTFREINLNRLALSICAILAARIPTVDNSTIGGQSVYVRRLLDLVEESYAMPLETGEAMLKLSLSALWNLTDEAPKTCEIFIHNRGLQLYFDTLVRFESKSNVEMKILGLLNNIAEVPHLRQHLVQLQLLTQLKKLIHAELIDVSYFAIGILVQLASDCTLRWREVETEFDLDHWLDATERVVSDWPNPSYEMVAYRSFSPFMPLLSNSGHPALKLWALWAIHHVCSKSPQRYYKILLEEQCITKVIRIFEYHLAVNHRQLHSDLRGRLAQRLINLVTVPDDTFVRLSTVATNYDCYLGWEEKPEVIHSTDRSAMRCTSSDVMSPNSCDCPLKAQLDVDPFLRLPALILKAFQHFSPVRLDWPPSEIQTRREII